MICYNIGASRGAHRGNHEVLWSIGCLEHRSVFFPIGTQVYDHIGFKFSQILIHVMAGYRTYVCST
jgi:hypothetical protein